MKTILVSLLLLLAVTPCLAADKVHLVRVDCSLIQGTQRIWLVAEPKLSAGRVSDVNCGEEVIARSSQDGWTTVLKQIGESPKWIEGYIGSSLLVESALPNDKRATAITPPDIKFPRGGGIGDGTTYRIGGAVTAPRALYTPDPDYTEDSHKEMYQGTVVLWLIVGVDGLPRDIRVSRPLGHGLDENAIAAVSRWRFEPATKDGKPVAVQLNVEVNFRLY